MTASVLEVSELTSFARETIAAARRGLAGAEVVERDLLIGGERLVRLRALAGRLADRLLLPFGCCAVDPAPGIVPPFEVLALDDESARQPPPPPPWGGNVYGAMDSIAGVPDGPVQVAYGLEQRVLTVTSLDENAGIYWARDPTLLSLVESGHLVRNVVNRLIGGLGLRYVHSASVGVESEGVLITGPAGAGKSTTALACMSRGFRIVGDDYVCASLGEQPSVRSTYGTAKLTEAVSSLFPELAAQAVDRLDLKTIVPLPPDRFAPCLNLRAIVVPRLGPRGASRVAPAFPGLALRSLSQATILLPPPERMGAFRWLSELVRSVPTYSLQIGGNDLDSPAVAIGRLLQDLCPATLSIIMCVRNLAGYIGEAVQSLLDGIDPERLLEIVVVDDASTDGSGDLAEEFGRPVRVIRQASAGLGPARNRGLDEAAGNFIGWLDADDLWVAPRPEPRLRLLDSDSSLDLVRGREVAVVGPPGGPLKPITPPHYSMTMAGTLARREIFTGLRFDETNDLLDDVDWHLRATDAGVRMARVDDVVQHRRHRPESASRAGYLGRGSLVRALHSNIVRRRTVR